MFRALAEVVVERGLRGASATRVARQAGVSRAALTEQFGDLDGCFEAMLEDMLQRGASLTIEAFERESSWEEGVVAGLEALLTLLDSEPVCARACLLESMTALPGGFASRTAILSEMARLVDRAAREALSVERQPPDATAEALIAAIVGMLRKRLLSNEAPPFVAMLGELVGVVVAPYAGPGAAARAAERADRRARELLESKTRDPDPEVEIPDMLRHGSAHRMRACMHFLAAHPGASNRQVATGIGVTHGGQASALLSRLHTAGLLLKECGGAGRPNAWRLSQCGAEIERVLPSD